ncbi:hypothetical protein A6B43_04265 [Vespertiliibacter pulmonis]|uniref:hypothetical protein n=1 Tax=Vespertiliibacter pulmonis TaxID=1443036 RepID=UPI000F5472A7|nr:hypothetical protein [Vespertiliibacter pulmonis]QLB20790.1 hypothetical protein A6B43_04265 [Vespertiliibacter pulmonis]
MLLIVIFSLATEYFASMLTLNTILESKSKIRQVEETGCSGATLMAMKGLNESNSSMDMLNTSMQYFYPNAENFNAYQQKYQRYQKLVIALKTLND